MKALYNYDIFLPLDTNTALEINEKNLYLIWNNFQAILLSKNQTTKQKKRTAV